MRIGIIVVVGVIVGIVLARVCALDGRVSVAARPTTSTDTTASARTGWSAPVRSVPVRQRDLEASDARYDAVLLSKENEDLSTKEIIEREPRDPAFAPTLEKRMHASLAVAFRELELEGKITSVETECKTLSCSTRIEVAREHGWEVYNALNGVMLGDVQEPSIDESDPHKTYVTFSNLYRAGTRDDAYHDEFVKQATRPSLDAAKQRMTEARNEARR
jgi:hypothetical protein